MGRNCVGRCSSDGTVSSQHTGCLLRHPSSTITSPWGAALVKAYQIALFTCALASFAFAQGPAVTPPPRAAELFEPQTTHDAKWLTDPTQGGFVVSGAQFPSAGKLLIRGPGDRLEACSGVLISGRSFLTAGHCVCPHALWADKATGTSYSEACKAKISSLSFTILFSGIGLFRASSDAALPDNYRPVNLPIETGETENSDIAVLTLIDTPPIEPSALGQFTPLDGHVSVGFGKHSFSIVPENSGFLEHVPYQDGPKQVAKYIPNKILDWRNCGRTAASLDSVCGDYNPLPREGIVADAASCGGDSGSPLYSTAERYHKPIVVGLASYVFPVVSEENPCDDQSPVASHFVILSDYINWISNHTSPAPLAPGHQKNLACRSAVLIGPGLLAFTSKPGSFSLSAFQRDAGDIRLRPELKIEENSDLDCTGDRDFGVMACEVKVETQVRVSIGKGFFEGESPLAQIVTCEK
ncbi:trypsin-like serine protease [Sinorhizobium meliloti]|nr:trypsin-like serine protease [Sinorhizobium meliloti]